MMDNEVYKSFAGDLKDCHIPYTDEKNIKIWVDVLLFLYKNIFGDKVKSLVFGHEHGEKNNKCHLQIGCFFKNNEKIHKRGVAPMIIEFKKENKEISLFDKFLIMFQRLKKGPEELRKYCSKGKNVQVWTVDKEKIELYFKFDKKGQKTVDPYKTLANNKQINEEDCKDFLIKHDARTFFTNYNNVTNAIKATRETELPEFEWRYSYEYLRNLISKKACDVIDYWFHTFCEKDIERRRALFIYGRTRGTGKTYWATHLVNDDNYVLHFKSELGKYESNKNYKLLVLDDLSYDNCMNKNYVLKQIVTGQSTQYSVKFFLENYKYKIPCIFITNELGILKHFYNAPLFKEEFCFVCLEDYETMTSRKILDELLPPSKSYLTENVSTYLKEEDKKFKEKHGLDEIDEEKEALKVYGGTSIINLTGFINNEEFKTDIGYKNYLENYVNPWLKRMQIHENEKMKKIYSFDEVYKKLLNEKNKYEEIIKEEEHKEEEQINI